MQHLIGTYECKVDTKGRIMMPVAIKKQLSKVGDDSFVLKRAVFNPCLELYPIKEWKHLMQKVNALNRFNKKNNDFIRRFNAGVKTIEMDASGRLLIPKDLIIMQKLLNILSSLQQSIFLKFGINHFMKNLLMRLLLISES